MPPILQTTASIIKKASKGRKKNLKDGTNILFQTWQETTPAAYNLDRSRERKVRPWKALFEHSTVFSCALALPPAFRPMAKVPTIRCAGMHLCSMLRQCNGEERPIKLVPIKLLPFLRLHLSTSLGLSQSVSQSVCLTLRLSSSLPRSFFIFLFPSFSHDKPTLLSDGNSRVCCSFFLSAGKLQGLQMVIHSLLIFWGSWQY